MHSLKDKDEKKLIFIGIHEEPQILQADPGVPVFRCCLKNTILFFKTVAQIHIKLEKENFKNGN